MRIQLRYWNRTWQRVAFEPSTGGCSVQWLTRSRRPTCGWAFRHRGQWYCLWRQGAELVFQAGTRRIPLSAVERLERRTSEDGKTVELVVSSETATVVQLRYNSVSRGLLARWDPAFDQTEEEELDFFLWLTSLHASSSRREALVANLADGSGVMGVK